MQTIRICFVPAFVLAIAMTLPIWDDLFSATVTYEAKAQAATTQAPLADTIPLLDSTHSDLLTLSGNAAQTEEALLVALRGLVFLLQRQADGSGESPVVRSSSNSSGKYTTTCARVIRAW